MRSTGAHSCDAVVIGAGAAGLFCAALAGQRGLRVLLIDHAAKLAEKIRISGGGRCNFTNRGTSPAQFLSENPHFCRSALARYSAADFIALVQKHGIAFHEKHRGQLFCDGRSEQIIDMLLRECEAGRVERWQPCKVSDVRAPTQGSTWQIETDRGSVVCERLVIATGGLSIPQIGASDFGLQLARRLGHRIIEPRPALVPLTCDSVQGPAPAAFAGLALPVRIATTATDRQRRIGFDEDLLVTHRGLSGPAVLQISSYWRPGEALAIDLVPGRSLADLLRTAKAGSRRSLSAAMATHLPQRLAEHCLAAQGLAGERWLAETPDRELQRLADALHRWNVVPTGTEGWKKAEVMAGGVDTRCLSSQTMESQRCPGLYFIGEVVDVTGWLGGYNFQWAWASAHACALALADWQAGRVSG